ncbi:MAG TPA: STN domain-containing protein, partial [Steroidobacteraceae bacterium]|nr:STN domain-containing protein [Steroidobacteraceae bacterium]
MKTLLSVVVGVTLAVCAGEPSAQTMSASRQVAFTIESGTLADALDQWAKQTGFQIVVQSWDLAKSIPAPALKGTFDAQAALDQLLKGTPLTYSWLTDRAVTIREKRSIASALWTLPLHAVAVQSVNLYGQSEN